MLEFYYYDFLDKYVDRSNFQLLEMDTDSLYMALSTDCLDDAVKPELRDQFFKEYTSWFPGKACLAHTRAFQTTRSAHRPWPNPTLSCSDCLARANNTTNEPLAFSN